MEIFKNNEKARRVILDIRALEEIETQCRMTEKGIAGIIEELMEALFNEMTTEGSLYFSEEDPEGFHVDHILLEEILK